MPLFSHCQSEYTHMWKKNNDGQSLPRVEKVASEANRIGQWRYEREREIVSSAPFTRVPLRGPLSPMGKAKRRGLRCKKGSQPRIAALGSPFPWKGLAWTLPPSYGRRCPEEAEVGWVKRDEKDRGRSSQVRHLREQRYPHIVRANTCMCGKTIPPAKPSPHGEGGERSEPDRALAV